MDDCDRGVGRPSRNRLQGADLNPPQPLSPDGTIIQANPRIGIWLMPDNMSVGELEDFVVQMIPEGDQVWPLSQRYIEEIPEEGKKVLGWEDTESAALCLVGSEGGPSDAWALPFVPKT